MDNLWILNQTRSNKFWFNVLFHCKMTQHIRTTSL